MKIILPLVRNYHKIFENPVTNFQKSCFNEKEKELFEQVLAGKITTNKQAATFLYDGNPSSPAFAKMKAGLIQKLTDMVANIAFPYNDNSLRGIHTSIYKDYYVVRILFLFALRNIAVKLAKKLLKKTLTYDIIYIGMDLAKLLGAHYINFEKNEKLGLEYFDQHDFLIKKYEEEAMIERYYGLILLKTKKQYINFELAEEAEIYLKKLDPYRKNATTKFNYLFFIMQYISRSIIGNHAGVLEIADEAIQYFEQNQKKNNNTLQFFINVKVEALLELGRIQEASSALEGGIDDDINDKWLTKQEMKTRLYFATGKYQEASKTIENVFSTNLIKHLSTVFKERWWLYKYYGDLTMLLLHDKEMNTRRIKHNLTRLKTDKKGSNVLIRVADIIHTLYTKDIESIYEMQDSIVNYIKGHLSDGTNDRSALFFNMLRNIPNSVYNPSKFESDIKNYQNELFNKPASITMKPGNEIIPYEALWELVIKILDKKSSPSFSK